MHHCYAEPAVDDHCWRVADRYAAQSVLDLVASVESSYTADLPTNQHPDYEQVAILLDAAHPAHKRAWSWVDQLVRRIIHKHLFSPIDDRSIEYEDLFQIALSEIASSLSHFGYRCRLSSWIHQITINSLRRGYRSRNALRRKGAPLTLTDTIAELRNSLVEQIAWRNLIQEIMTFLNSQADARLAVVFYLGLVEEQRLVDIARYLDLSIARVHSLLRQTRHLLRQYLALSDDASETGCGVFE